MDGARIIDGKVLAAEVRAKVSKAAETLRSTHGVTPGLAVILVGDNPASQVYVRSKKRQTVDTGMNSIDHALPAETSEAELLALVDRLNANPKVHGILVQLPLPEQIDADKVLERVHPSKDVDGFHPMNAGRLSTGQPALVPCTPVGSVMLAKQAV